MLYWFHLNHLSPIANWRINKNEVKNLSINTCQVTQSGRHQSGLQQVLGSIPTEGNIFAEFILFSPMLAFEANFV